MSVSTNPTIAARLGLSGEVARQAEAEAQINGKGAKLQGLEAVGAKILRELLRDVPVDAAGGNRALVCVDTRRGVLRQALEWEAEMIALELGLDTLGETENG